VMESGARFWSAEQRLELEKEGEREMVALMCNGEIVAV